MERKFQFSVGEYYHIFSRGVDKRPVFLDERDHDRFSALLYTANNTQSISISNFRKPKFEDLFSLERQETLVDIGCH